MTKLAFENISGDLFELTDELIENGLKASRESERLRMILPLHRSQEAEVQRMLNFMQPGTYARPHFHSEAHASESIVVLRGSIRFFTHDDEGEVKTVSDVSAVRKSCGLAWLALRYIMDIVMIERFMRYSIFDVAILMPIRSNIVTSLHLKNRIYIRFRKRSIPDFNLNINLKKYS
jgi:cupin fold WbuC family metalloprotein